MEKWICELADPEKCKVNDRIYGRGVCDFSGFHYGNEHLHCQGLKWEGVNFSTKPCKFVESVNIKGFGRTLFGGIANRESRTEYKLEEKKQQLSTEKDAEKKKQLQEEVNGLQSELDKIKKRKNEIAEEELGKNKNSDEYKAFTSAKQGTPLIDYSGPKFAKGGITVKPIHNATMGEAGPEAIIPLHKLPEMLNINSTNDEAMNKMVALLSQQNTLLADISNRKINVMLEGTKVGTGLNTGAFVVT
jgi:hypothetical protein